MADPLRLPSVAEQLVLGAQAASPTVRLVGGTGLALLVGEDTLVGPIRVESLRDQRANKMVALLGRSELRDLVDLFFIEKAGLPVREGFADALRKDAGMDPAWFAWALGQIEIKPLPGLVREVSIEELAGFRDDLQRAALERAGA